MGAGSGAGVDMDAVAIPRTAPRHWRLGLAWALGFVALYAVAVVWEPGQRIDARLFGAAQGLASGALGQWLPGLSRRALPLVLVLVLASCSVHAHAHRGWRPLVRASVVVVLSLLLSRLLRDYVLWRPVHDDTHAYLHNTFPSTHVTLVAASFVALWLLVPRHPWWLGPVVGLVLVATVLGNIVGHAHRPSDTIGSILLVAAVASVIGGRW